MDSLTHLLVGHAMGAVASSAAHPYGAVAYWAAVIGNSLPDIDVPVSLLLRRDTKLHRTVTHTVPAALILSALTAGGISLVVPGAPFLLAFGWTLMGYVVHLGMDCLNLFGPRPFWPLSRRSVALGILHILDPVLLLLLGLPALAVAAGRAPYALLGAALSLIVLYVLYRIGTARRLYRQLKAEGFRRFRVVPWFAGWRYIFETDRAIEFGAWVRGRRKAVHTYPKQDSPLVRATLSNPHVAAFLKQAEYPYALVQEEPDGYVVVWGDALRQLRADFRPLRVRVG